MTNAPNCYAGIDVAKDHLDVMLRPSGKYLRTGKSFSEVGIAQQKRRS